MSTCAPYPMVANDPKVMASDIATNVERLLRLNDVYPAAKVPGLLAEAPRLLYHEDDDVAGRLARTVVGWCRLTSG